MGARSLIYGPNLGSFDITMPITQKQAVYHYEDCQIDLTFKTHQDFGNIIDVKQHESQSGCGFGHNVYAEGIYYKVENN